MRKQRFLEKLDPRSRLLMVFCFSCLALFFNDAAALLAIFLCLVILLVAGGKPDHGYRKAAGGLIVLILPLFLIQCLFVRTGNGLLYVGSHVLVTDQGFNAALCVALRLLVFSFSAMILNSGEVRDYLLALVQCKVPYELAFMVMLGIHFIPLLGEEGRNLIFSIQMRGTDLKQISIGRKIMTYSQLLLPILAGALYKARMMALAMETRAFRALPKRTCMRRLELKSRDKLVMGSTVLISCIFVAFRILA